MGFAPVAPTDVHYALLPHSQVATSMLAQLERVCVTSEEFAALGCLLAYGMPDNSEHGEWLRARHSTVAVLQHLMPELQALETAPQKTWTKIQHALDNDLMWELWLHARQIRDNDVYNVFDALGEGAGFLPWTPRRSPEEFSRWHLAQAGRLSIMALANAGQIQRAISLTQEVFNVSSS